MAGLCWMTVLLVFFLSVGSLDAVDQSNLAKLIQAIKEKYTLNGMFSLALSIKSEDPEQLTEEFYTENPVEQVKEQLSKGGVYNGPRLAVATVDKAKDDTLGFLQNLKLVSSDGDLLVIYSDASPCPTTCTDIVIKEVNSVIGHGMWTTHVFVFEKVLKPKKKIFSFTSKTQKLIEALKDLGKSRIPLANIFRCYKPQNVHSDFQCTSCSNGGKVAMTCVDYNA